MTHSPRIAALTAVIALALAPSAIAQDEAVPEPTTYSNGEDGSAIHAATGVVCPPAVGDMALVEVLSFDRNDEHLGLTCNYVSPVGSSAAFSLIRADVPELVGPGTDAERWNRSLYAVLGNYNGALPAQVDGLDGDDSIGLRGALFSASGPRGVPLQIGLWHSEADGWILNAEAAFVPTTGGWAAAGQMRQIVIDAKVEIESD